MDLVQLLAASIKHNASDIHLSSYVSPLMRVNGDLISVDDLLPLQPQALKELIYSAMTHEQQKILEAERELDFAYSIPKMAHFRVNAFHNINGPAAVFRVIPQAIPTLDSLGLPSVFKKLLELSNGLILVTGQTGSGKSTTLAAMVEYLNAHHSYHIITIEDPIEFVHHSRKSLISQRQVHRDTLDFSTALKSALRQDPDVIMLGELRDLETIRLALTAAETGHLVIATLHASSAPRAVSRMIDVFPSGEKNIIRNMLSESLQAIICQTLVNNVFNARVAAMEVMIGTPAIRHLIREDKVPQMVTVMQTGGESGMCTLEQYLQNLAAKQIITTEVLMTQNKETFKCII